MCVNTSRVQKPAGSTKPCLLVAHGTADAPFPYLVHGVPRGIKNKNYKLVRIERRTGLPGEDYNSMAVSLPLFLSL